MWTWIRIVIGAILCCLFGVPFMHGFITEFFRLRRESRQPRLRLFKED
jgi:hypothetical protein